MKKVAIVTMYTNNYNFGGQLQAYALQKKISALGFDCEVVNYLSKSSHKAKNFNILFKKIKTIGFKSTLLRYYCKTMFKFKCAINRTLKEGFDKKRNLFNEFIETIPHSIQYNFDTIGNADGKYDIWVVGSDQVWNPEAFNSNNVFLLSMFHGRKIAYAASSKNAVYTDSEIETLKNNLNSYFAISVREEKLADVVNKSLNMSAEVVIDPTGLYSAEFWNKVAIEPTIKEKYAFVYLISPNNRLRKSIYEYCRKVGLKMVIVPHAQGWYKSGDERYFDYRAIGIGPKEWIGYIKNASIVFTDSFHGTIFSVNLNKDFWSFENITDNENLNMGYRKYSLLTRIGLRDRCVPYSSDVSVLEENKIPIDYAVVNRKFGEFRNYSDNFLNRALREDG